MEIASAAGDLGTAECATDSLREIAQKYGTPWLLASAQLASARTALLAGDVERAVTVGADAVARWAELGAPYETAVARMVLAEAQERSGCDAAALLERRAAATAFTTFGAERWAAAARSLAKRRSDRPPPTVEQVPAAATFSGDGDLRRVSFRGRTAVLRDLKGFRYVARLLAEPGREFHVLDLVAVEQGTLPTSASTRVGTPELHARGGQGLPVLDEQARATYRKRLIEVEEDIEEAARHNDTVRAELAARDREYLITELSRAVGLGGRLRSVGGDAERARVAVTRALRYAIRRLSEHDEALAGHLANSVHTGNYCSYRPDPLSPVAWNL